MELGNGQTDSDYMALRAGATIGRYRVVSVLGQGSFGVTYRVSDPQLGRDVAIKEYLPASLATRLDGATVSARSKSAEEDFAWGRDRFLAEGRTLAALHHAPGIVRVHDFLEANGTAYLVMELLQGETLEARIARAGCLDAATVERILGPLLDGLERVHQAGFLHRDIKPSNILLDGEGRPTLIDFGSARAAVAGRAQAMTAVFTPAYAAIEQLTAATQAPSTDIYGLSATLHHAITGRAPPGSIDRVLDDSYRPLAGRLPYPAGLLNGIDAGLAIRAADRPQSIADWRTILRSGDYDATATVAMRAPLKIAGAVPAPPPRPARMGLRWGLTVGGVLCLLAIAAGIHLGLPKSAGPDVAPKTVQATVPDTVQGLAQGTDAPGPATNAPAVREVAARSVPEPASDQALLEQKKTNEELARLRSEAEARRKADEEAALRRRIEEELARKAEAEAQARRQAEQDAKAKVEEEAAARRKAEEEDRQSAELAETALHLGNADRQRLQVALTSLGFSTGGTDGVFGPRSREMIAAWQRQSGFAATGFLKADQQAALLRTAASAIARFEDEQRREDQRREDQRREDQRKGVDKTATTAPGSSASPGRCEGTFRSQWCRGAYQGFPANCWWSSMTITKGNISDSFGANPDPKLRNFVTGSVDAQGAVSILYSGVGSQTHIGQRFVAPMRGAVANGVLTANGRGGENGRDFTVRVECR